MSAGHGLSSLKHGGLRWCLPQVQGRGAGLGNELITWARVQLMAQVLGGRALHPAFGLNQRAYHRHFGTSRGDWLMHRALAAGLPAVDFNEAEYLAAGGGDVVQAFGRFAHRHGLHERSPLVVRTQGMWGGFAHIARARAWARARLHATRWAATNLAELGLRLDPDRLTVAMHVRLGDFQSASGGHADAPIDPHAYRNRFNRALPLTWFAAAGAQLQHTLGSRVQFQVFSDGTAEQLKPLTRHLHTVPTHTRHPGDVSDLLAMSQADLLLCSVSSYSAWAAFLSDAHYLWFAPQLQPHGDGWGSIWGHETAQRTPHSPTLQALAQRQGERPPIPHSRAWALSPGNELPTALIDDLLNRHAQRRCSADLVRYGVTEIAAPQPFHTATR